MRKIISYLLIAALMFPWEAYAQSSVSTTSVNHPAFATLLQQVQKNDSAGIDVPVTDPVTNTPTTKHNTLHDLSDAEGLQSNGTLAAGCNPVVWANMVQQSRKQVVREVTTAMGAHDQLNKAVNNKCTSNLGPNGENRPGGIQPVRDWEDSKAVQFVCSMNWSSMLHVLLGGSLSFCRGGKLFSGSANQSLQNSFLLNGQDPTKSKNCIQPDQVNQNLMTQTAGSYGTSALNGSSSSNIRFDSGGTVPSGSGPGFTLNFSGGGGVGNNGVSSNTGASISGTGVNASSSSSSSVAAPPVVTNPTSATPNIYK